MTDHLSADFVDHLEISVRSNVALKAFLARAEPDLVEADGGRLGYLHACIREGNLRKYLGARGYAEVCEALAGYSFNPLKNAPKRLTVGAYIIPPDVTATISFPSQGKPGTLILEKKL